MSEILVACANCGKRYKGTPGPRKFKCANCHTLFTFPEGARSAPEGKVLCAFCWSETDSHSALSACPSCGQKLSPKFGGRAAMSASASSQQRTQIISTDPATSGVNPTLDAAARNKELASLSAGLADEVGALQRTRGDLEAKIAELIMLLTNAQTQQSTMRMERDKAIAELEAVRAEAEKAKNDLDRFKHMASSALEPMIAEYKKAMKQLIAQHEVLRTRAKEIQDTTQQGVASLNHLSERLEGDMRSVRRHFAEQLSVVLGTDAQLTPVPIPGEKLSSDAGLPAVSE